MTHGEDDDDDGGRGTKSLTGQVPLSSLRATNGSIGCAAFVKASRYPESESRLTASYFASAVETRSVPTAPTKQPSPNGGKEQEGSSPPDSARGVCMCVCGWVTRSGWSLQHWAKLCPFGSVWPFSPPHSTVRASHVFLVVSRIIPPTPSAPSLLRQRRWCWAACPHTNRILSRRQTANGRHRIGLQGPHWPRPLRPLFLARQEAFRML